MAVTIGKCRCVTRGCEELTDVREMKGLVKGAVGRLYLFCPSCGKVSSAGQPMQDYISKNMVADGDKGEQKEIETPPPESTVESGTWDGW